VTGTVTAFWRELRGSGSFMDTDPAKIRGGVNRFLRSYGVARLREGFRKMAWGVHACSLSEKTKNNLGKKCPVRGLPVGHC
jgi:hypothetical protein